MLGGFGGNGCEALKIFVVGLHGTVLNILFKFPYFLTMVLFQNRRHGCTIMLVGVI